MGIESYSLTIITKEVSITRENGYQSLIGTSMIDSIQIIELFENERIPCIHKGKWLYADCLELFLYQQNNKFQGIEIKGCLSWLHEGVKECFQLINLIKKLCGELDIYVLDKRIYYDSEDALYQCICELYSEKISIFSKQYNNVIMKATCGQFYKEIDKHNKWYYKLIKWIK